MYPCVRHANDHCQRQHFAPEHATSRQQSILSMAAVPGRTTLESSPRGQNRLENVICFWQDSPFGLHGQQEARLHVSGGHPSQMVVHEPSDGKNFLELGAG